MVVHCECVCNVIIITPYWGDDRAITAKLITAITIRLQQQLLLFSLLQGATIKELCQPTN